MTAIDPRRLRREAEEVAQAVAEPVELLRRCESLLERYADHIRRPAATARSEHALPGFGSPQTVTRALARALDSALGEDLDARMMAVSLLWQAEYRETQLIAAELLGGTADARAAERIEKLLEQGASGVRSKWLAQRGLRGLRVQRPTEFLAIVRRWLESSDDGLVSAGLLALSTSVEELPSGALPELMGALQGLAGRLSGQAYRNYRGLLRMLADRIPGECAQFLLDELRRSNYQQPQRELARELLPSFSGAQREKIVTALTASRS